MERESKNEENILSDENTTNNNNNSESSVIKICYDTNVKKVINYAIHLLEYKNVDTILLCGLSLAISKVILVAEIVKTKVKNLHQISNIDCLITKDKFDPNKIKRVPKLDIILTKIEPKEKGMGYQKPMSESEFNFLAKMKGSVEEIDYEGVEEYEDDI